jgi:hypothetical protein
VGNLSPKDFHPRLHCRKAILPLCSAGNWIPNSLAIQICHPKTGANRLLPMSIWWVMFRRNITASVFGWQFVLPNGLKSDCHPKTGSGRLSPT